MIDPKALDDAVAGARDEIDACVGAEREGFAADAIKATDAALDRYAALVALRARWDETEQMPDRGCLTHKLDRQAELEAEWERLTGKTA